MSPHTLSQRFMQPVVAASLILVVNVRIEGISNRL